MFSHTHKIVLHSFLLVWKMWTFYPEHNFNAFYGHIMTACKKQTWFFVSLQWELSSHNSSQGFNCVLAITWQVDPWLIFQYFYNASFLLSETPQQSQLYIIWRTLDGDAKAPITLSSWFSLSWVVWFALSMYSKPFIPFPIHKMQPVFAHRLLEPSK